MGVDGQWNNVHCLQYSFASSAHKIDLIFKSWLLRTVTWLSGCKHSEFSEKGHRQFGYFSQFWVTSWSPTAAQWDTSLSGSHFEQQCVQLGEFYTSKGKLVIFVWRRNAVISLVSIFLVFRNICGQCLVYQIAISALWPVWSRWLEYKQHGLLIISTSLQQRPFQKRREAMTDLNTNLVTVCRAGGRTATCIETELYFDKVPPYCVISLKHKSMHDMTGCMYGPAQRFWYCECT